MMAFWAVVALLLAGALLMLLPPLWRPPAADRATGASAANLAVYRDQWREAERDLDHAALDASQLAEARDDIRRRWLEEAGPSAAVSSSAQPARRTALALALLIPLGSVLLYLQLGHPASLTPAAPVAATAAAGRHGVDAAQIQAMVAALAERLKAAPGDAEGWLMLGPLLYRARPIPGCGHRLRPREGPAAGQCRRAGRPGRPAGDGPGPPPRGRAHAPDPAGAGRRPAPPEGPGAGRQRRLRGTRLCGGAWVLGASDRRGPRPTRRWPARCRPASRRRRGSRRPAGAGAGAAAVAGDGGAASPPTAVAAPGPAPATPTAAARVAGEVQLAEALAAKVAPGDTLFVFARAVDGPRMPLAILRRPVDRWPAAFSLDDSLAMSEALRLSGVSRVVVGARISRRGDATPQPGDLVGSSGPVAVGVTDLRIVIDRVQP